MSSNPCHTCSKPGCRINDRVLIVDDEPGILFAYRRLLEQEGLTVDSCDCLCEALDYLACNQYLAVVADMRLQGTGAPDGLVLLSEVRRQQPEAGVIVASGTSDEQLRGQVKRLGVEHYLEKPVNPARIMDLLNELRQSLCALEQPLTVVDGG